jgi:hypothetical protein
MKRMVLLVFLIATGFYWVKEAQAQSGRVEFNGHEYEYVQQYMLWTEARAYAESLGGYLVCITDESENSFVANLVGGAAVWIGAHDSNVEGQWEWVSGEAWEFTSWLPGEPNGLINSAEDYISLNEHSYATWNDTWDNTNNLGFVVEFVESNEGSGIFVYDAGPNNNDGLILNADPLSTWQRFGSSASGLIHHYTFNDGNVTDLIQGQDGALFGGGLIENGELLLDGVDDYVQFDSYLIPATGGFTVSFVAKTTSPPIYLDHFLSQGSFGDAFMLELLSITRIE